MTLTLLSRFSTLWLFAMVAAGETDLDLDGREHDVGAIPSNYGVERVVRTPNWCGTGQEELQAKILKFEDSLPKDPTYQEAVTYGGELKKAERWKKAREFYLRAEHLEPGDPEVALAIALCSEGLDDLPGAIKWAEQALERQPSDVAYIWVYLRIIRAKAASRQDTGWLRKGGALGLDFGQGPRPTIDATFPKEIFPTIEALLETLGRHLYRYAPFIDINYGWKVRPHADPFAAELLLDWGNILALCGAVRTAIPFYELAENLQAPRAELARARLAFARKIVAQRPTGISR